MCRQEPEAVEKDRRKKRNCLTGAYFQKKKNKSDADLKHYSGSVGALYRMLNYVYDRVNKMKSSVVSRSPVNLAIFYVLFTSVIFSDEFIVRPCCTYVI